MFQVHSHPLSLLARRCGAWAAEVSLIVASALVPYSIGLYTQSHLLGKQVALNPLLATAEEALAKTFSLPVRARPRQVGPLTNLFWSGALVMPVLAAGWQIYLLGKTGRTLPKALFGLQVVTATGAAPGLRRALLREGVGRSGLPLGLAYLFWRCSGAVPDLGILTGLAGLMLLADSCAVWFDSKGRTLHDRLGGTFVVDALESIPKFNRFDAPRQGPSTVRDSFSASDEDAEIAALVLTPETRWQRPGLLYWIRQNPGLTLVIVTVAGVSAVLATFAGTQIYIQSQVNWRQVQQLDSEKLLALVSKFAPDERRGAILALGTIEHPEAATQLLADMLSLETEPKLMDAIGQALLSTGPKALPYLQRLNQSLKNDQDSLRYGGSKQERELIARRLRTTQRTIAKILTLYNEQVGSTDLSRLDLGQTVSGPGQFTLVLDYADLSGIQLRGSILTGASFRESRFYNPGEDGLFGTFDDRIADLSGAELKQANFSEATLVLALMNRANLMRAELNKANLFRARLSGANLSSAQLLQADLRQAVLSDVSLTGAELREAKLAGANLQGARLGQVTAKGASFQAANLSASEWLGADLSGADFSGSNLQNSDLSSARLAGANLSGAQLQRASLRNADLVGADLRGANLAGADFQGATFVEVKPAKPDQFIQIPPAAPSTGLQGVEFSFAKNLNAQQISYICAQGGLHPKCPSPNPSP
ncbi:MAG: pentapeptide repeat-containing protein [Oscillatoria princeps RMCB-10]|nr:pentapeptide repeat-containing protein [Oscillatoria princeps RMCB-10]